MGMGFAPTWLRQVSPHASHDRTRFWYHPRVAPPSAIAPSSGRLASLELASADRHVAAVTVHVQVTAQDCAVCSLLQLLIPHTFAPRSRPLILLITVRCPSSR